MRIVHVSTSDSNGGAARAAYRLHRGLRRLGHDSKMLVLRMGSRDADVIAYVPRRDLGARVRRMWRRGTIARDFERYRGRIPAGYEPFGDDRSEHGGEVARQIPACDVINLHWV